MAFLQALTVQIPAMMANNIGRINSSLWLEKKAPGVLKLRYFPYITGNRVVIGRKFVFYILSKLISMKAKIGFGVVMILMACLQASAQLKIFGIGPYAEIATPVGSL